MVTWLQCPTKALNVAYGNSFSNQWALDVGNWSFQVQLLKLLYHKNYAVYFVEICIVDIK